MAQISLRGINKIYPNGTHAVRDVDLDIADGEFMIMVGPSGCAKSTILRMIAGLETPSSGTVSIGGAVMNAVAPKDRDIAMVFQSYALYPHMTVRDNMAFGLRLRKMPEQDIQARVAEAARILGLEQLLDRLPKQMSGGQRQRVAMGRAIVREPQAFLMDEPLSNLDAKLRVQMRTEIAKLHQRLQTTTVYVTHDQVEAMTLGQRICILRTGVVQQVDTPFMVYHNPANVFVAGFIGSPGMNFMRARLTFTATGAQLTIGSATFELPADVSSRLRALPGPDGGSVIAGIRPEHLHMTGSGMPAIAARVDLVETLGSEAYAYLSLDGVELPDLSSLSDTQATATSCVARMSSHQNLAQGSIIHLTPDLQHIHLFDPTSQGTLLAPALSFSDAITVTRPQTAVIPATMIPATVMPAEAAPAAEPTHVPPSAPAPARAISRDTPAEHTPRARIASASARAELSDIDPALRIRRSRTAPNPARSRFQRDTPNNSTPAHPDMPSLTGHSSKLFRHQPLFGRSPQPD
jgi:multiple sugar transport system ATP-binding protein